MKHQLNRQTENLFHMNRQTFTYFEVIISQNIKEDVSTANSTDITTRMKMEQTSFQC